MRHEIKEAISQVKYLKKYEDIFKNTISKKIWSQL